MSSSSSCTWTKKEWPADFGDPNAGLPKEPDGLAITSRPDPFWHTTRGKAVIVLVILSVIGAIVGGAIGARGISRDTASTSTSSAQSQVVQKTTHAGSVVVPIATTSSNLVTMVVPEPATSVEGIPISSSTSRPVGRAFAYREAAPPTITTPTR